MIGMGVLIAYVSAVPTIGLNCGAPSYVGVNVGPLIRGMAAVCGIALSTSAWRACGVPDTAGSTAPASDVGGMRAKSGGSALLATNAHGPESAALLNQRPASNTK